MAAVTTAVAVGVGAAVAVGGTVYGAVQAEEAQDEARRARMSAEELQREALKKFEKLEEDIPSVESRLYELERFKQVANLTPELEQAILQEETELKKIAVDPKYKAAQLAALNKYEEIEAEGGLTPVERSKLEKIKSEIATFEKSQRGAILQKAAQQGTLTGGGVLTAQLLAQQEGANRASELGFDVEAEAWKRRLDAIEKGADLGGKMHGQEYGEQRDAASAQDFINKANVMQRADVQRANIDRKNQENMWEQQEMQRIADSNTRLTQEEQRAKAAAKEREFEDKLRVTAGAAGQLGQMGAQQAGFANAAQQAAAQQQAAVTGGAMKIGGSLLGYGLGGMGGGATTPTPKGTPDDPFSNIG